MPDIDANNAERRSFLKWSLLGLSTLVANVSGYGQILTDDDKEQKVLPLPAASTVITDGSKGSHHRLRATQHFFLANPINAKDGQRIIWEILQDEIGGHLMTLDNKFVFGDDLTKASLSVKPNKRDFLTAIYNQPADQWHVVAFIRGY